NFATRRQAQHAHVAVVAAAPQTVVGIQFARLEVHARSATRSVPGIRGGPRRCAAIVVAADYADGKTRNRSCADEMTAPEINGNLVLGVLLVAHGVLLSKMGQQQLTCIFRAVIIKIASRSELR